MIFIRFPLRQNVQPRQANQHGDHNLWNWVFPREVDHQRRQAKSSHHGNNFKVPICTFVLSIDGAPHVTDVSLFQTMFVFEQDAELEHRYSENVDTDADHGNKHHPQVRPDKTFHFHFRFQPPPILYLDTFKHSCYASAQTSVQNETHNLRQRIHSFMYGIFRKLGAFPSLSIYRFSMAQG